MSQCKRQKKENARQDTGLFYLLLFVPAILIYGGCTPEMQKPARVCPGKATTAESLSSLKVQLENAVPLKAGGQCLLQYYTADKKSKKENFPVKLWLNPPAEIYMQGDIAFDPKGIILGSNEDQFWLAVRLKEVSSFWSGRWSQKDYPDKLMINPRLVLEALGAAATEGKGSWSLSKEGAFDVLTKQQGGVKTKKIYISTCDYLIRKIEYLSRDGRAAVVMELDRFKKISKNFFVPHIVKILNRAGSDKEDSVQITFSSVKVTKFTDKQRSRLFIRPQPQGYKHIYNIVDGKIIEQLK